MNPPQDEKLKRLKLEVLLKHKSNLEQFPVARNQILITISTCLLLRLVMFNLKKISEKVFYMKYRLINYINS